GTSSAATPARLCRRPEATTRPARAGARAGRVDGRRAPGRETASSAADLRPGVSPLPVVRGSRGRLPVLDRVVVLLVRDVEVLAPLRTEVGARLRVGRAVARHVGDLHLD